VAPKTLNVVFAADSSQVGNAFSKIEAQSSSFGDKLSSVGKGLTAAVTLPLIGLGAKAVSEASEARVALGQTEAVIKSTGGAANVTADQILAMSDKLGNLAGIEGEVVQESSNLLATFTGIRNEAGKGNDVFNQSQQAILDMGIAMNKGSTEGLDLQAATIQVGKALNDPIKGMTALSKVGVSFTESQKKQVEAMVESGDTMGAQKLILAELNKEFGGSAKAAGESLPPMQRMQLAFANMAESIGTILLPIVDKVSKFLSDLASKFSGLSPEAQKMVVIFGAIAAAVGPLLLIFGKLISSFKVIKTAMLALSFNPLVLGITLLVGALVLLWKNSETFRNIVTGAFEAVKTVITNVIEGVRLVISQLTSMWNDPDITSDGWFGKIEGLVMWFRTTFDSLKAWWDGIWPQFSEAVGHVWTVISSVIQAGIAVVSGIWQVWGDDLLAVLKGAWDAISAVVSGAIQVIGGIIKTVLAVINGDWGAAWDGIKQIFSGVWEAIKGILSGALGVIKGVIGGAWDVVRNITSNAWNAIRNAVSEKIEGVLSLARSIPGRITSALGNLGSLLYSAGKDVVQGLINGVKSMGRTLVSAIVNLIPAPVRGVVKSALGIGSPSKVFQGFGRNVVEGLIVGLDDMKRDLSSAAQSMANRITDTDFSKPSVTGMTVTPALAAIGAGRGLTTSGGVGMGGPMVVQLVLDRRVISEVVLDEKARKDAANGQRPSRYF
jgi:phage-related protein